MMPSADADRWERVQSIFAQAADLSGAGKRRLVEEQCGGDSGLAESVFALLAEDERGQSLLDGDLEERVAAAAEEALRSDHLRLLVERQIGPYKLLKVLGEGGMGIVYLAQRTDIGGLVAVKLLRDAWLSPMRRERFALEQQTLVKLNHPAIARLYDASTMEDGTPWFVMEYADGRPLTEYVRARGAGVREDLLLFRRMCAAVQYAHAHAVIHRDLKPSNVLVTEEGEVKLLDFGIAKQMAVEGSGGERTIAGLRLLTPGYAAPEQYSGGSVGVYTDVYALGVMLYEMLTGQLPDAEEARAGRLPARPSVLARAVGNGSRAKNSAGHSATLSRREWAELDVLCLKALEPEPARRYGSVDALMRDISAYLEGRPLEARPNSFTYTAVKFVRRNRLALGSVAAGVVLLIAGALFFTVRLERARNSAVAEAQRTERIQHFLLEMLGNADQEGGPANDLKVVTLLDNALAGAGLLSRDAETQAQLYQTIGSMYNRLGKYEQSEKVLSQALERATQAEGQQGKRVAEVLVQLAVVRGDRGELAQAQQAIDKAESINTENRLSPNDPTTVQSGIARGRIAVQRGEYQKAVEILSPIAQRKEAAGELSYDLRDSASTLAEAYLYTQRYDLAERYGQLAIGLDRKLMGGLHPKTGEDIVNLASVKASQGDYAAAEALYREGVGIMRAYYGADNPDVLAATGILARTLAAQGKFAEAEPILLAVLREQEKVYGPVHERVAFTLDALGSIASQRKDGPAAEAYLKRALATYSSIYATANGHTSVTRANLGAVYLKEGRYDLAESTLRQAAQELDAIAKGSTYAALAHGRWGCALLALKRYEKAQQELAGAYAVLKPMPHPPGQLRDVREALVKVYLATHHPEQAKPLQAELAATSPPALPGR